MAAASSNLPGANIMNADQLSKAFAGLVLAVAVPSSVAAQSAPNINVTGEIEVEVLHSDGSDETFLFGDIDLSFGPAAGAGGLGFDLGVLAIDSDGIGSESAIFAAATYRTSYGKFSFGLPRNAASAFSRMPDLGGTKLVALEQDIFTGGIVELFYLLGDDTPVGLRYDGEYGMVKTAVSYHRLSDSEATVFDVAASFEMGKFFTNGSVEIVKPQGTSSQSAVHAEIGASTDLYEAGIGYTIGSDVIPDAFMAWATYRPVQKLDISATVLDIDGTDALYGLSGTYAFWNSAYVQAGVADSSGIDAVWDLSLGYKF